MNTVSRKPRISTVTPIEPALEIDNVKDIDWKETADVVVVGWGAAGACAALEARSKGATVIQIHGMGPFDLNYVNAADDPQKSTAGK